MSEEKLFRVLCDDQWVEVTAESFGTNVLGELVFRVGACDVALFSAGRWVCVLQARGEGR